jgi:hypothetical protein
MIFGGRGPPSLLHLPLLCILDVLCIVVLAICCNFFLLSFVLLILHEECKQPELLPLAGTDNQFIPPFYPPLTKPPCIVSCKFF